MRDCICLCFPIDGSNDTDKLLASLHLMGIYFGRHTAQPLVQMSPRVSPDAPDVMTLTMLAAKSRLTLATPGTNRSWLPPDFSVPDQVQGRRAAWLPKLPLVPSFHLLPAKFWNLFHIMNMSGVCAPVYIGPYTQGSCLRSVTVSTVICLYPCLL